MQAAAFTRKERSARRDGNWTGDEDLPQPWTVAMEATIFTGWIYDHLLPHAKSVKSPTR